MSALIGALVLVLIGLAGARLSFKAREGGPGITLFLATGTHFLFLGFLLGPELLGVLDRAVIGQLYPLLALCLGWVGLLFGLQLDRRQLRQIPLPYLLAAAGQALVTFLVFLVVGLGGLEFLGVGGGNPRAALFAAAATACVSSPIGIAAVGNLYVVRGRVSELLLLMASLDAVVGVVALQAVHGLHHPFAEAGVLGVRAGWEWLGLATALGVVFGIFFLWVTRPKPSQEELVLFLLGLSVFLAGTSLFLGVSTLYVAMISGAVVANISPLRRRVYAAVQAWEKQLYVVLLLLLGALLSVDTWLVLPLALAYTVLRGVGKLAGGWLAGHMAGLRRRPPPHAGLALVAQGGISIAMVLSVAMSYGGVLTDGDATVATFVTAIVLGIVLGELVGPGLARRVLRAAGELAPASAAPAAARAAGADA